MESGGSKGWCDYSGVLEVGLGGSILVAAQHFINFQDEIDVGALLTNAEDRLACLGALVHPALMRHSA